MSHRFVIWRSGLLVILSMAIQAFDFSDRAIIPGKEDVGQGLNFLPPLPPAVIYKLYAGFSHTLAIRADSTLWAWGSNNEGQIGNGSLGSVLIPAPVNGLTGMIDAAGGFEHSIALRNNGTVWAWGRNSNGQLGDGTLTRRLTAVAVGSGFNTVVNIGAGYYHSLAIKADGTVWTWGRNNFGQLGNGNNFNTVAPAQVGGIAGAIDVAGGEFHSVALKSDGSVWTWGYNASGQLGNGNTTSQNIPVQVTGISNVTAIAAGRNFTMALKADGTVWAWGDNSYGQLGNGNTTNQSVPVQVTGLINVATIAAGERHSLAVRNEGTAWAWGYNGEGQLGNGVADAVPHAVAAQVGALSSWVMAAAATHSAAVKNDGTVWVWGNNASGQLGNGNSNNNYAPQLSLFAFTAIASATARPVMVPDGGAYVAAQAITISCATTGATIHYTNNGIDPTETDPVIASGGTIAIPNGTTILKARAFKAGLSPGDIKTALYQAGEKLVSSITHNLAIKSDSSLWAWGNNNQGQIGNGGNGNVWIPIQLNGLTRIRDAAAGAEHSLALKADGTVLSWGRNSEGQLGDGTLTAHNAPGLVGLLSNIVNVGAGYQHSFAIKNDGTLYTWGQNTYGQLGIGNTFNSVAAMQVPALTGVIDATGGDGFSIALKSDGTVWTWGYNGNGQLGDGTNNQRSTPLQINLTNVIAIAAGRSHAMALKADGTIWAWGYNANGQLGNADANGQNAPLLVTGISNVMAIAAGESHSLAVKRDGTLWAWGSNSQGQSGNGTADDAVHYIPVQTGILSAWSMAVAGAHSLGVKNDGSVWAWGNNASGQFGTGTNANSFLPKVSLFSFAILATQVERPKLNIEGGSYTTGQTVTVTCATPAAAIHYSIGGADPVETDPVVTSGATLTIGGGVAVLKLGAFKPGFRPSEIKSAVYQVGEKAISGYAHSIAIRTNGKLWIWGNNSEGQLGIGTTTQKNIPFQHDPNIIYKDAAGGFAHTVTLRNDGTVYAWGRNAEGQIGDGTLAQQVKPTVVRGLSNIIKVGTGYYHSLAIKNDGTLWTWGQNINGQLGNGTLFSSTAARKLTGISGVTDVSGGEIHTVALKEDGSVWTWGGNAMGQLGDGTNTQRSSPVLVYGIKAMAIAAGRDHTLALATDGTVWAWGNNSNGQLGIGSSSNQLLPVRVTGLNNVQAIAAGEYYSLAVKTDGTVWAWGINAVGQLGDGTNIDRDRPVKMLGLSNAISMSAGNHSIFVTPIAGINLYWASGYNDKGQVGDSTLLSRNFRVLVHFPVDANNNSIPDWVENQSSGLADTDRDGLTDWKELLIYGTDPLNFDSNGDGLADGVNVFIGLKPVLLDTDGDGISNMQEILNGTSPIRADTDGDGVPDNLDAFPLDRFRSSLPSLNPADHTAPVIILLEPF